MSSPFQKKDNLILSEEKSKISVTFPIRNPSYRVKTNKIRR